MKGYRSWSDRLKAEPVATASLSSDATPRNRGDRRGSSRPVGATPTNLSNPVVVTDSERAALEKLLGRHPAGPLVAHWSAQWNQDGTLPPKKREIIWRARLLAARAILLAGEGQTPEGICRVFCGEKLTRPIRPDLSKPLVDASWIGRILASWESSRKIGLSVSQRLRYAASGNATPSPEDLQRRFAEQVDRWWNKPGRVDYVPPQEPAAEHQTASGDAGRQPEGDRTRPPAESDGTVDRQPAAVAPIEETPLSRTLHILKGSSKAKNLVKYLHEQTAWKATLREVTRRLYIKVEGREPTAGHYNAAKQLIRRKAKSLAGDKAPLRIEFDWDRDEISLVDIAATPGPT
jgi:hypothetical protein